MNTPPRPSLYTRQEPSFLVRRLAELLGGEKTRILDVGCGNGADAFYLAKLGHAVVGVSNEPETIRQAQRSAAQQQLANCGFAACGIEELGQAFSRKEFGAVLVQDTLHLVSKPVARKALTTMQHLTTAQGLHAVRGYVVGQATGINARQMFRPGELVQAYDTSPGWEVQEWREDSPMVQYVNGRAHVQSHVEVIAQKVGLPS